MGAIIQGAGASELRWDAQKLVVNLSRQVFGAMWDALVARLTEVRQSHGFFVWTQPAMTIRGDGPDAPRWKVQPLDVLSGLLFLLKVPTDHELVRLWAVIDWSALNALCAPLYHNAHGGPHAWAPAQMIALLTLRDMGPPLGRLASIRPNLTPAKIIPARQLIVNARLASLAF